MVDFNKIRAAAEGQKWKVTLLGNGHWRFVPPDPKAKIVIIAGTPSDHRALKNALGHLRKSGFNDGVHAVRHG